MTARRVPLLPIHRLELQPISRPHTRPIRAIDALGDDTLHIERRARVEQSARRTDERADCAPSRPEQIEPFEQSPTLAVWPITQIVFIEHEQIERDEGDVPS